MSRETKLFINIISHFAAALFTVYLGSKYAKDFDAFSWSLTTAIWIGIAGHRNGQLIKAKYAFNEVIQEAMDAAMEIKETVNTLKVRKITKDLQKDMIIKASIQDTV